MENEYEFKQLAGDGGPGVGGEAAPRPADSSRLELTYYKWTRKEVTRVLLKPHRCNVRTCPRCGPKYGWRVRNALLAKANLFSKPALLTLTVDRRGFESPADAHDHITSEGLIRRMLRFLDVELWLWVLEFQEDSGSGWPHWHILIDLASVPGMRLDLARAWELWRKKWGIGGLDLRVRRHFEDATYAIHYITLYMTKSPKMGFPQWVRHSAKMRFFQACHKLGPILTESGSTGERQKLTPEELAARPKRAKARTIAEREAECGMKTTAVEETEDLKTKECSYRYLGTLLVRPQRLVRLSKLGELVSPVDVRLRTLETKDGMIEWLEPVMPEKRRQTSDELVKQLRDELQNKREDQKCINDIEDRRKILDSNNKFSARVDDSDSAAAPGTDEADNNGIPF